MKERAAAGIQPYAAAVAELKSRVGDVNSWLHGTASGAFTTCTSSSTPEFFSKGGPQLFAMTLMYHVTGEVAWARQVRTRLLDAVDTSDFGGAVWHGGNQCILNLAWNIPNFVMAADLLESFEEWTAADKAVFQRWLSNDVYKKVRLR